MDPYLYICSRGLLRFLFSGGWIYYFHDGTLLCETRNRFLKFWKWDLFRVSDSTIDRGDIDKLFYIFGKRCFSRDWTAQSRSRGINTSTFLKNTWFKFLRTIRTQLLGHRKAPYQNDTNKQSVDWDNLSRIVSVPTTSKLGLIQC